MRRRHFTQLLALGAGAQPLLSPQAEAQSADATSESRVTVPAPAQPVNVEEYIALARAKLPKATFEYITTGSADGLTVRENVDAFRRINVLPPLLRGVEKVDLSTKILNQHVSLPILLAPVAALRMYHPQGALAAARAAAGADTILAVSSSACNSVEEIAHASTGPKWYQLYVPKDRGVAKALVERVERAGFKAIVLTVDLGEWKDSDRRNQFKLPKDMLLKHLRDIGHDQLTDAMTYEELLAFNLQAWDLAISWKFFDWLRSVTKLPLLIKGVLREDDARKAVSIGVDGIVVSNHGGRRLDSMPASIDMLPRIADAVAGKAEILMDGGVRRGTDVLKAIAFGARAVLIGRPHAWALAAHGEAGVRHVIELLRLELENAMIASGCATVGEIDRSLIVQR